MTELDEMDERAAERLEAEVDRLRALIAAQNRHIVWVEGKWREAQDEAREWAAERDKWRRRAEGASDE